MSKRKGSDNLPAIEQRNNLMNDIYWKEMLITKHRLQEKYEVYRIQPMKHKYYNFYCRRFQKDHRETGTRFKDYWEKKVQEWYEQELSYEKIQIWKAINEEMDKMVIKKEKVDETSKKTETHEKAETVVVKVEVEKEKCSRCEERDRTEVNSVETQTEKNIERQESPDFYNSASEKVLENLIKDLEMKTPEKSPRNDFEVSGITSISKIYTSTPHQQQIAEPSTSDDSGINKVRNERFEKIWENDGGRDLFELKRDMLYLKAWLDNLGDYEKDNLVQLFDEEQGKALDLFFDSKNESNELKFKVNFSDHDDDDVE